MTVSELDRPGIAREQPVLAPRDGLRRRLLPWTGLIPVC
jgi:hypothetical protein